jgi:hypothetical protein
MTFKNVWFRKGSRPWRPLLAFTYQDIGSLDVSHRGIEFHGRTSSVIIRDPLGVSYGLRGADFLNQWIDVRFDNGTPEHALFKDGRWWGWHGVLGGTKRLYRTMLAILEAKAEADAGLDVNAVGS